MKSKSIPAQVASLVRSELKTAFPNTKFKVRSETKGGTCLDISWQAVPSFADVNAITAKYVSGKFNGMIDMYENTNSNPNLPQVKYIFLDCE